jgi:hypothetical protein
MPVAGSFVGGPNAFQEMSVEVHVKPIDDHSVRSPVREEIADQD